MENKKYLVENKKYLEHEKYLERVICKIGSKIGFRTSSKKGWTLPSWGYSYNNSISDKALNVLMKANIIKEKKSDVICMLSDWTDTPLGIYFTKKAMYVTSEKNGKEKFRVSYDNIKKMEYEASYSKCFTITTFDDEEYDMRTPIWDTASIKTFLEIASGNMNLDWRDEENLEAIDIDDIYRRCLEDDEIDITEVDEKKKEYLEKVIYEINKIHGFKAKSNYYRQNQTGFSYDDSRYPMVMSRLAYLKTIKEKHYFVIGMLCELTNCVYGYIFTDKAMYSCLGSDDEGNYSVKYKCIRSLDYNKEEDKLTIVKKNGVVHEIAEPNWDKKSIKAFLKVASGNMNLDEEDKERLVNVDLAKAYAYSEEDKKKLVNTKLAKDSKNSEEDLKIDLNTTKNSGAIAAGVVYGNVSNASTIYGMDKFNTPRGHGFAAEQANHLYAKIANADLLSNTNVKLVGDDIDPNTGRIVKNGADRVVNGVNIQTKYCASGSKCISECFDNGTLKYLNGDGTPMQIEVPSDKYDAAVKAMENRIKNGEVPGISDPSKAKEIVRKGSFTYEQAKNIAKFGTVESVVFDSVNGAIISTCAMGISATLTFATVIWSGEDFDVAIKKAAYEGLKVGSTTFVTAVLSSQLSRAGLNSALVGSSEALVALMGPKASAILVNAFRNGSNIYGAAAMKSAAKMLRGNAITGAVSIIVLSSVDIADIFRGRISGGQLFKNLASTASTVAAGSAGWVGGATAGASAGAIIGSIIPGVGNVIGGAIGGFVGGLAGSLAAGTVAGKATGAVLDEFIEDDANIMVAKIEKVFTQLAEDYLLNKKEVEIIVDNLKDVLSGRVLKDMYESSDRTVFARNIVEPLIEKEVKKRDKIKEPTDLQLSKGLRKVLEELSDLYGDNIEADIL